MNLLNLRKMLAILQLQSLVDRSNYDLAQTVERLISKTRKGGVFTEKEKRMYEEIVNKIKQNKNKPAGDEFQAFEYEGEVKNGAE
jgi:hypothetical protein